MIKRDEIKRVAALARLKLSDEEMTTYGGQLDRILEHVDLLQEVDVSEVEPMAHASAGVNDLSEDTPRPSLSEADVLRNAPDFDGPYFRVPKTV